MYAGEIVEAAPARELFDQPRHPYTLGLMNSFPSISGEKRRLTGIPGAPPDLVAPPGGCTSIRAAPALCPFVPGRRRPLRPYRPSTRWPVTCTERDA
jgi:peptide/nickel transport system ATP-binding protein